MSVIDKFEAAKNVFVGDALGLSIGKATSHELIIPKKKHIEFLLNAISIEGINISQIGDGLIARINNTSWIVIFKALLTCHHLFIYGHEKFLAYMATKPEAWIYPTITDTLLSNVCIAMKRYSEYLNSKCTSFRFLAFDCCNFKTSKDVIKGFDISKIIKYTFYIQNQFDALLNSKIDSRALSSKLCSMAAHMLFRDFIRLYAVLNEVQINLIERYYDLKAKEAKQAFTIYKKFYECHKYMDSFNEMAKHICIPDSEIPTFVKPPSSLLEAMENHLLLLEKPQRNETTINNYNPSFDFKAVETIISIKQDCKPSNAVSNLLDMEDIFSSSNLKTINVCTNDENSLSGLFDYVPSTTPSFSQNLPAKNFFNEIPPISHSQANQVPSSNIQNFKLSEDQNSSAFPVTFQMRTDDSGIVKNDFPQYSTLSNSTFSSANNTFASNINDNPQAYNVSYMNSSNLMQNNFVTNPGYNPFAQSTSYSNQSNNSQSPNLFTSNNSNNTFPPNNSLI